MEAMTGAATSESALAGALLERRCSIPAIVVRGGVIATLNEAAQALLACETGQPISAAFDAPSQAKLAAALASAPASCEVQARSRSGADPIAIRVEVAPFGAGTHLVLVAHVGVAYTAEMSDRLLEANDHLANLTREVAMQAAELDASRARFEALADLREHFVSMLAHDLRGSLHAISLSADTIEHAVAVGAAAQLQQGLERVRRNATRIEDLVAKVLDAARLESGRMEIEEHPVSLRTVAGEAISTYDPSARNVGVELAFVDRAGEAMVTGDLVRLGQVVGNLVDNAIRFSPRGGVVTLELDESPGLVRLSVADQGPGIPEPLRDRVFDRFAQGRANRGGLGVGLYVARQLVELHGGRIYVEDVVPHGAAIVVVLPARGVPPGVTCA